MNVLYLFCTEVVCLFIYFSFYYGFILEIANIITYNTNVFCTLVLFKVPILYREILL